MNHTINVRGRLVVLDKPQVMGILNATPDSFYEGSRKQTERDIAERALQIVDEGGTMIDVGAFSTRPGANEVSEEEELNRLRFALGIVRRELPDAIVSVDTYRPLVARQCVEEWGADMINDVSEGGLTGIVNTPLKEQYDMFQTIASLRVPYILMSVRSTLREMLLAFAEEIQRLHELGVCDVIIDPGFGFGKTLEQNYQLMKELDKLLVLDLPLLVGVSRKSMIYKLLDGTPSTALNGTTVLHTVALQKGASILRVHDVREAVETIKIVSLL
ncbi:MAG: dihydropteroate synthase [Prevotella sp.]|nr:dihydropteroate synthase [Prevotella sp.]